MYGFSQDEKHLLFIDCFGLTRLSAPKKVKTDRKITGSDSVGLATVSRDGSLAGSWEDLWQKSVVWNFPELKSARRLDRFEANNLVVHPEGTHYLCIEYGKLKLEPVDGKTVLLPLRLDAPPDEDEADDAAKPAVYDLSEGGETRPAVVFEGAKTHPDVPAQLRIAHDGTVAYFDHKRLICATLQGSKLTVNWRREVCAPDQTRVDIYADRERVVLSHHRGKRYTIAVILGDKEERFEVESLATPAFAGPYLAYQPDEKTVRHRNLDSGDESEYSLEVYAKKRKVDLPNTGPATLFCGASGRLVALAAHRESLLDLVKGVEIPRKLPAKELELRQALLAISRPYTEAARLAGVRVELGRVEIESKRNSLSITNAIHGHDDLFGALLASHAYAVWSEPELPDGWRMGGYGAHGGISAKAQDITLPELVEGYSGLTKVGVSFGSTISFWSDIFDSSRSNEPPRDPKVRAFLARALMAALEGGRAAKLDYGAIADAGAPTIDEVKAALDAYKEHANSMPHNTIQLCGKIYNQLFGAKAAALWAHCMFDSPVYEDGSRLWDYDHYAIRPLIKQHPEAAETYRSWFANNELPDTYRRSTLEQLRQHIMGE